MLVDSHCHLDRVDLTPYDDDFSRFMIKTRESGVSHMLCVAIDLENYPAMLDLVRPYREISVSVGVHPNDQDRREPSPDELVALSAESKNVAIGETGLDYYYGEGDMSWQQERFRRHIQAARMAQKPLIIHTRDAREDTLRIMAEERAADAGGVMHCFTETWEMAKAALDMGFYISFSGIVTFKNAEALRDVARRVPLEQMLIETDSPYLAPVPHRGKPNEPCYVRHVCDAVAKLRGIESEALAEITRDNFYRLFSAARQ